MDWIKRYKAASGEPGVFFPGEMNSAVKRSIGLTFGFYNHGEGRQRNYHRGQAAIIHYANQPARPL